MVIVYANNTDFIVGLFSSFIMSLDCVINGWCLVLLLKSTKNVYKKLCFYCDNCFKDLLFSLTDSPKSDQITIKTDHDDLAEHNMISHNDQEIAITEQQSNPSTNSEPKPIE